MTQEIPKTSLKTFWFSLCNRGVFIFLVNKIIA